MKISAVRLFVILVLGLTATAIVASITGCASGPFSSNLAGSPPYNFPPGRGDNHTPVVYTSPSVTPAPADLPAGITHP
jgi:hypothetical protein